MILYAALCITLIAFASARSKESKDQHALRLNNEAEQEMDALVEEETQQLNEEIEDSASEFRDLESKFNSLKRVKTKNRLKDIAQPRQAWVWGSSSSDSDDKDGEDGEDGEDDKDGEDDDWKGKIHSGLGTAKKYAGKFSDGLEKAENYLGTIQDALGEDGEDDKDGEDGEEDDCLWYDIRCHGQKAKGMIHSGLGTAKKYAGKFSDVAEKAENVIGNIQDTFGSLFMSNNTTTPQ